MGKLEAEILADAEKANADAIRLARQLSTELKILARCATQVRHTLRAQGDFANADALREGLDNAGFYIEDRKLDGHPLPPVCYRKHEDALQGH